MLAHRCPEAPGIEPAGHGGGGPQGRRGTADRPARAVELRDGLAPAAGGGVQWRVARAHRRRQFRQRHPHRGRHPRRPGLLPLRQHRLRPAARTPGRIPERRSHRIGGQLPQPARRRPPRAQLGRRIPRRYRTRRRHALRRLPQGVPVMTAAAPNLRVLVAEDDAMVRRLLAAILEKGGYQVVQAGDGAEALRRLEGQAFDAIVLDLLMPVMDGLRFLHELREVRGLEVPVLVLTASLNAAGGDERRILDAGANRVARKPVTAPQLLELLQQTLAG
ncbi:MAG TPA: response regulator [Gammaproteobacteria bacterium]|nr:response regulator [Gammaproteobacteria bacterium]